MKLEFESQSASLPMVDPSHLDHHDQSSVSPEVSGWLKDGIEAAQSGDRAGARALLLRVTDSDPDNESAWLWLASISEYPEELLVFLNNVLRLNPENERAVEWAKTTKSLLAKNFVERGAEAAENDQMDYARQCFMQAIVHDDANAAAWLWLASLSSTDDEKRSHLSRVLRIDPSNESALAQMKAFSAKEAKNKLMDANRLAIAGGREEAVALLDEIVAESPEMEDAWMLKAHLADSFDEKIRNFERVLQINEENQVARANLDSLKMIVDTSPRGFDVSQDDAVEESHELKTEVFEVDSEWEQKDQPAEETLLETGQFMPEEVNFEFEAEEAPAEVPEAEEEPVFQEASAEDPEAGEVYDLNGHAELVEDAVDEQELDDFLADSAIDEVPFDFEETEDPGFQAISQPESDEEFRASEEEADTREFAPVDVEPAVRPAAAESSCPFCGDNVEHQSFVCMTCNSVLTLSDLEMILSNEKADTEVLEAAVKRIEADQNVRGIEADDLRSMGIAYINLRQYRKGFEFLQEYSAKVPNDVVLRSQLDALAVRVSEIEQKEDRKSSEPASKTILVVDDSPTIRKLISLKLQKCGHETICAVDGVDALEKINDVVPDLVLLDITMPRMDGYQVCKLIRGNEATKDVPIVMISGKDGFFDKVRGKMAGTSNYITKPFGPETLMRTVNEYLS